MNAVLIVFSIVLLAGLPPGAWCASTPQKVYESSGSPKPEYLLEELRAHKGRKFWVRRPLPGQAPKALFCDSKAPPPFNGDANACPVAKFGVDKSEPITIVDVLIAKPNPASSWMQIQFESGKTAYLSLQDFTDNRYREDRVSADLYGVDHALANSGWLFDEYPEQVLSRRRAQLERNEPGSAQRQLEKERVIRASLLHIGMTAQQVLNSSWGRPNSVNTVTDGNRSLEQWDYGAGNVLYFDRGRLQRFQATQ